MTEKIKDYDREKFEDITTQCRIEFQITGISVYYGNKRIIQSRKIDREEQSAWRSGQMFYVVPEFRAFVHLHQYPMSFAILRRK